MWQSELWKKCNKTHSQWASSIQDVWFMLSACYKSLHFCIFFKLYYPTQQHAAQEVSSLCVSNNWKIVSFFLGWLSFCSATAHAQRVLASASDTPPLQAHAFMQDVLWCVWWYNDEKERKGSCRKKDTEPFFRPQSRPGGWSNKMRDRKLNYLTYTDAVRYASVLRHYWYDNLNTPVRQHRTVHSAVGHTLVVFVVGRSGGNSCTRLHLALRLLKTVWRFSQTSQSP